MGTPGWRTVQATDGLPSSVVETSAPDLTPFAEVVARRAVEFEERGYVVLRGLIGPGVLAAWARHVTASYRNADERASASTPFARTLDAEQPGGGTVRWGTGMVPIAEVSLELAATLDALIGGLDRLVPWMSDYLSLSRYWPPPMKLAALRSLNRTELFDGLVAGLYSTVPQLVRPFSHRLVRWGHFRLSWHLDETPTQGRIEEQKLAVLGLVLLTDVSPEDGPTAFLPDSPTLVARSLVEEPGRNQDDRRWTASIARRCGRRVLATGCAGDVFLLHPLTLHARAQAWRSSLRIVANPNFFARERLSYLEPRSPVERYAGRAL